MTKNAAAMNTRLMRVTNASYSGPEGTTTSDTLCFMVVLWWPGGGKGGHRGWPLG